MATIIDRVVTKFIFDGNVSQLTTLERRLDKLKVGLNTMARGFTMVGAAFTAATGSILSSTMDTDRAMNQLAARTGASTDALQRFKDQAYEIGSGLPLNTADIIQAQTNMIQLGNTMAETYAAMPAIANAAVASGENIADVAQWATVAKNTFNVTGDEMSNFLNVMLKAETILPATMKGMGEGLQFSSQTAKDAGLSWQEYIATLGMLGGAGREVQAASQGLGLVLTNLARGATGGLRGGKLIETAFGVIGVGIERVKAAMDVEGGGGGFFDVLQIIQDSVGDLTQSKNRAKLTAFMAALGGTSYAPALQFVVQNLDQLIEKQGILGEAYEKNDEHLRQVAERMKGQSGAWDSFFAQIDTLNNKLADAGLAKAFEDLLRWGADWVDRAQSADQSTLKLVGQVLVFGSSLLVLGGVLKITAFLITPLTKGTMLLASGMVWAGKATGFTAAAMRLYGVAAAWAARRQVGLNAALIANPIGLIVSGIAIAVTALALFATHWDEVKAAAQGAMDWMREKVGDIPGLSHLLDMVGWLGDGFLAITDLVHEALGLGSEWEGFSAILAATPLGWLIAGFQKLRKLLGLDDETAQPEEVIEAQDRLEARTEAQTKARDRVYATEGDVRDAEEALEVARIFGEDSDAYRKASDKVAVTQALRDAAKADYEAAVAETNQASADLSVRQGQADARAAAIEARRVPVQEELDRLREMRFQAANFGPERRKAREHLDLIGGRDALDEQIGRLEVRLADIDAEASLALAEDLPPLEASDLPTAGVEDLPPLEAGDLPTAGVEDLPAVTVEGDVDVPAVDVDVNAPATIGTDEAVGSVSLDEPPPLGVEAQSAIEAIAPPAASPASFVPSAPPVADRPPVAGAQTVNNTLEVGEIRVDAPQADGREVAMEVNRSIRDYFAVVQEGGESQVVG